MANKSGSKLDVVMKMGLVLFISLLSFAVGTFVGKKFSDNQHKVASYEHGEKNSDQASNEEHAEASRTVASVDDKEKKDALTDDEIAKLAEEFVAEEDGKAEEKSEHAAAGHEDERAPARKAASTGGHASEEHAAADAKAEEHAGGAKESAAKDAHAEDASAHKAEAHAATPSKVMKKNETAEKAKAELTSAPQGKYTVQIAAYPSEAEAQKTSAGLKEKGFSAFYVPAKIKDKTWYRVSVGLFTSSDEADEYRKKLDKEGISKTIVQKVMN